MLTKRADLFKKLQTTSLHCYTKCIFTCGRRPTGHRVIQIVVVVGGGGNIFYTWALGEPMYGLVKNQSITPMLLYYLLLKRTMYGLDAHVC